MTVRHSSSPIALPSVGGAVLLGAAVALFGPWSLTGGTFAAIALLAGGAGVVALVARRGSLASRYKAGLRSFATLVGVTGLGALLTLLFAWDQAAQRWPAALDGERVIAEIAIDSLPSRLDGMLEFDADARIEAPASRVRSLRVRVRWAHAPRPEPAAGERWRVMMTLSAMPQPSNPGAPDVGREWLRDRLHAAAVVLAVHPPERLAAAPPGLLSLRGTLERRIRDAIVDRDAAALVAGLAVGATGAISREQWRVFSVTGTTHLVAISGLHVTLFAWLAAIAARALWRSWPALQTRIDREPLAAGVGISAAFGYALLAGFGIPTQRTVVMLAIWWAGRLAGRTQHGFDILGIAALAVWLVDPFAPLSSGFWLSFAAMAVLLLEDLVQRPTVPLPSRWARLSALIGVQWRVSIALAPLTLAWFGSVAWLGVLVNLVAIPVFSFLLVPLALAGLALAPFGETGAAVLWRAAETIYLTLWPALQSLAESRFAALEAEADAVMIALLVASVPLWILPVPGRWRAVSLLAFWPWALPVQSVDEGEVQVTLLDAGDGAALIARTREHTLVIDTGEVWGSDGRRGATLVAPALRALGRSRVDRLVLSAAHGERSRGAAWLAHSLPVGDIVAGGEWPGAPQGVLSCDRVRRWRWDGVDFVTRPMGQGRAAVCTVRISVRGGPAMWWLERADRALEPDFACHLTPAEVVVVPRRGSLAAVDPSWVSRLGARDVLVSAGRFDAAREQRVLTVWGVTPERIHATARDGAISIRGRPGEPAYIFREAELRRRRVSDGPA